MKVCLMSLMLSTKLNISLRGTLLHMSCSMKLRLASVKNQLLALLFVPEQLMVYLFGSISQLTKTVMKSSAAQESFIVVVSTSLVRIVRPSVTVVEKSLICQSSSQAQHLTVLLLKAVNSIKD